MKKILTNIITIIAMVGLVLSCKGIVVRAVDLKESKEVITELKTDAKTKDLKARNEDYRFWLTVENTKIDYPVAQAEDNEFYLSNDFNGKESIAGTPFLDYRNIESDKNIIVYAHNMRDGSMFGDLKKFKEEEFFKQNNEITLEVNGETFVYEVFSAYTNPGTTEYLQVEFSGDEYSDFLNTALEKSLYRNDVEVSEDDSIITFSTCSPGQNRTVIHGKLVK